MDTLIGVRFGFALLTLICFIAVDRVFFPEYVTQADKAKFRLRFRVGVALWLVMVSVLSLSGFLSDFSAFPPRMVIVIVVPLLTLFVLMRSRKFKAYVQKLKAHQLVLLQAFRIPVEYFLWLLFTVNITPVQMTFEGRNWDIITGLLAPLAAYLMYKKPQLARPVGITFNLIGLLLLINIVTVAILSMPGPIRVFMNEPANIAVSWFPMVFLPAFLVPMAYYLHALSLRQLMATSQTSPATYQGLDKSELV